MDSVKKRIKIKGFEGGGAEVCVTRLQGNNKRKKKKKERTGKAVRVFLGFRRDDMGGGSCGKRLGRMGEVPVRGGVF